MRFHKRCRTPRVAALAWGLGFFLAAQLALNLALERWRPELRDPEYVLKLKLLRHFQARSHGRPLVLVLGSSRVQMGLRAGELADEPGAAVFNFGMLAAGPVADLMHLRRLLADGVHPDYLVIEVMTPLLRTGDEEAVAVGTDRLSRDDLALLRRYAGSPSDLSKSWWLGRLLPCYSCRFRLVCRYAPSLLPRGGSTPNPYSAAAWQDASGWSRYGRDAVSAKEYARYLATARGQYAPVLADFRIAAGADRALREMLALCRQERIGAALLLMPEGADFRSLYPPAARVAVDEYLSRLRREYGVPLIDARDWVGDDGFWDSHHLLRGGAATFTRRFGREALPLVSDASPGRSDEHASAKRR